MMWETMAETQEAEIEALETEISLFKRKDADVSELTRILERRYRGFNNEPDCSTTDDGREKLETVTSPGHITDPQPSHVRLSDIRC